AQDEDREDEREPEGEVADAGLREGSGRLALLEPGDRVGGGVLALHGPAADEPGRHAPRDARDDDRGQEEPDDQNELRESARQRDQIDEVAHATSKLAATSASSSVAFLELLAGAAPAGIVAADLLVLRDRALDGHRLDVRP